MTEEPNPTLDSIRLRRRRRTLLRALGAGVVLVAAGGAFLWLRGREEQVPPMPPPSPPLAEVEQAPAPAPVLPGPEPVAEPEAAVSEARPLPPLGESDPLVRQTAAVLSSRPELVRWLASDELIRRIVAGVDAVAQGESPVEQAPASMRPQGKFEVVASGDGESAAPSAFARYATLTEVVVGLDSQALVRAYRELQPLFEQAHRDLGQPDRSFDAALREAIFELLSAPIVVGEPRLQPIGLVYGFEDPALEDLSSAQKQLLRFGPVNAARVQRKLRELALGLRIPEAELPKTPLHEVRAAP